MAYYQQDMLSIRSRALLAHVLAEALLLCDALEPFREALARVPQFDCIALFRFLDREEKGYLREKDFERAVGTSHRKLLTYAFSWFDSMKVGEVSRLEFAAFLLPRDHLALRTLVAQRVEDPQLAPAQHETILEQFEVFRSLLLELMRREMKAIELRRQLVRSEDYSPRAALLALDGHDHQWLSPEDIHKFLQNYGYEVTLRQVEKLVEAVDSTLTGRLSQQQLTWTVEGFETKDKTYLAKIKASNKKEETPQKSVRQPLPLPLPEPSLPPAPVSEEFRLLMEKMRLAELEEQQVDEELVKYDLQSIEENKMLCESRLQQQKQAALRLWQAQERRRLLQEEGRAREEQLRREAERIRQLQHKLKSYADYVPYPSPVFESKRLYSFAEQSPSAYKARPFEIIDAHLPLPRKDYQYLTNLNALSIVESHRKASGRSEAGQWRLSDRSNLQARQSQLQYNTSRFNSRVSENKDPLPIESSQAAFESPQRAAAFRKEGLGKQTVSTGGKYSPLP